MTSRQAASTSLADTPARTAARPAAWASADQRVQLGLARRTARRRTACGSCRSGSRRRWRRSRRRPGRPRRCDGPRAGGGAWPTFGPAAMIVSKPGPLAPRRRMALSSSRANSASVALVPRAAGGVGQGRVGDGGGALRPAPSRRLLHRSAAPRAGSRSAPARRRETARRRSAAGAAQVTWPPRAPPGRTLDSGRRHHLALRPSPRSEPIAARAAGAGRRPELPRPTGGRSGRR